MINDNYVFSRKVIELSKVKNPSMFKRLKDGTPFNKSSYIFEDTDSFLRQYGTELMINMNKKGKFNYSNEGYDLLYELFKLLTDKNDFFEETRDRILIPLNLEDKIMPFYEVPIENRYNFPIHYVGVDAAMIRELKEEANITVGLKSLELATVTCRLGDAERDDYLDFYFIINNYEGEIHNNEPEKCGDLKFFDIDSMPNNTVDYVTKAVADVLSGKIYDNL